MKTLFFLMLVLWASFPAWSQTAIDGNIYFDFNSSSVKKNAKQSLDSLIEKYFYGIESVTLSGRTDSVGDVNFNYALAQKRIDNVAALLAAKNISNVSIGKITYGETNPVADNMTTSGRAKNRSVNITLHLNEAFTRGVDFIYKRLGTRADSFEVNNNKATVLRTKNNCIIKIPANSFVNDKGQPISGNVNVKVTECLQYHDMLFSNLTTQTESGDMLQTGGMLKIVAERNGINLNLRKNTAIEVKIPADSLVDGMKIFYGKQDSTAMKWTRASFSVTNNASDSIANGIAAFYDLVSAMKKEKETDDLSFDVGKELLRYNFNLLYEDNLTSKQKDSLKFLVKELITNGRPEIAGKLIGCLLRKQEEKKINQVIRHLNIQEVRFLADAGEIALQSAGIHLFKGKTMRYLNLKDPVFANTDYSSLKYIYYTVNDKTYGTEIDSNFSMYRVNISNYIMQVTKLDWVNCDKFDNSPARTEMMVTFDSDVKPAVRLAFKRLKAVIAANSTSLAGKEQKIFNRIPSGENATLIAYAMKDGSPYLATKKIVTGQSPYESLHLEKVSLEEFERQMKSIN